MQPIGARGGKVMYFGSFYFRGELGYLNCDDICMCVVNKQFEHLGFVLNSVYVDLKYNDILPLLLLGMCVMWSSLVCL